MPNRCPTRIKLRWHWWSILLIFITCICLLDLRRPRPAAVILPLPDPKPTRLQALIDQSWSWLQFHLPGKRKGILVRAKVLKFSRNPVVADQVLGNAAASNGDVRIWVFEEAGRDVITRRLDQSPDLEMICQPGIQSASGIPGSMTTGSTVLVNGKPQFAGIELDSVAKCRNDGVDLATTIRFTEPVTNGAALVSIKTNLAVRSRIQVPRKGGALVLSGHTNGSAMAVLFSAAVQ
jgi:hypothetical protein